MADDLLARMEALREWLQNRGWPSNEHAATLTEAIARLRSQEATVRECAEICQQIIDERTAVASRGDEGAAYEADWTRTIKAAILSRFGLTEKKG